MLMGLFNIAGPPIPCQSNAMDSQLVYILRYLSQKVLKSPELGAAIPAVQTLIRAGTHGLLLRAAQKIHFV